MPYKSELARVKCLRQYYERKEQELTGLTPDTPGVNPSENEDLEEGEGYAFLRELRSDLEDLASWARGKMNE